MHFDVSSCRPIKHNSLRLFPLRLHRWSFQKRETLSSSGFLDAFLCALFYVLCILSDGGKREEKFFIYRLETAGK